LNLTEIKPNLYQSGVGKIPKHTDIILNMDYITARIQNKVESRFDRKQRARQYTVKLHDSWNQPPLTVLETIAGAYLYWKEGFCITVRCGLGLNRSSLITAGILVLEGYNTSEAVHYLRKTHHSLVLFNPVFGNWADKQLTLDNLQKTVKNLQQQANASL